MLLYIKAVFQFYSYLDWTGLFFLVLSLSFGHDQKVTAKQQYIRYFG